MHLLACQCGASLGLRMVTSGVAAFWGYTVDFLWLYQRNEPADLADDDVAAQFFEMDLMIDRGVLAGRSAAQIHDAIGRYVAELIEQGIDKGSRIMLLSNYVHLMWPGVSWGDPKAVV